MIQEAVTYNDVLLVPQYSDIKSRNEVKLTSNLSDNQFRLPIIASPMDTVSEKDMVVAMADEGGLAIVHRYNTIEEQANIVEHSIANLVNPDSSVAAAIGTSGDYLERAVTLVDRGANILCVDVAHGHHILMKQVLQELFAAFFVTISGPWGP